MKTAMQELIEHIEKIGVKQYPLVTLRLIKDLQEKEKQQIIDAANHGVNFDNSPFKDANEYYSETFKNK